MTDPDTENVDHRRVQAAAARQLLEALDAPERERRQVIVGTVVLVLAPFAAAAVWAATAWWIMLLCGTLHSEGFTTVPAIGWWAAVRIVFVAWAGPALFLLARALLRRTRPRGPVSATGWVAEYETGKPLPVEHFDNEQTPMVYAPTFDHNRLTAAGLVPGFVALRRVDTD